jgi:hypothetical protein
MQRSRGELLTVGLDGGNTIMPESTAAYRPAELGEKASAIHCLDLVREKK